VPILRDRLFDGGHSGHVDGRLVLQGRNDLLRLRLGQLPERTAIRPTMARLTLARKIATITLTMWKKGVSFDPQNLHRQAA
jgi:hypothetical protein